MACVSELIFDGFKAIWNHCVSWQVRSLLRFGAILWWVPVHFEKIA